MRMLSLLSWGLGAGALAVAYASSATARPYVVSLVPKDLAMPAYLQLASMQAQLVVTMDSVAGATRSLNVDIPDGETLFIMENQAGDATPHVWGEKARLGAFIVLSRPDVDRGHMHTETMPQNALFRVGDVLEKPKGLTANSRPLPRGGQALAAVVDPQELLAHLQVLAGEKPFTDKGVSRTIPERGSRDGKALARAYLRQQYEALGFTVSEVSYGTGVNFIAEKAGTTPQRFLLLASHLDSVDNAGADDNGAGTITNLVAAKALVTQNLAYGIRVLAFDQEEDGLVGSTAYARGLNRDGTMDQVVGVIDMEMTAYDKDGDGGYHVIDCNENTSADLTARFAATVSQNNIALTKVAACTNRSDHAVFWKYHVPSIVVSENFFGGDSNPCYHKRCDKTNILNFDYMAKITEALIGAAGSVVVP